MPAEGEIFDETSQVGTHPVSEQVHNLALVIDDGVAARCSCGWHGRPYLSILLAYKAFATHIGGDPNDIG